MSAMICGNCGKPGIEWKGPISFLTHTECPHCGGTNCQRAEAETEAEPKEGDFCPERCGERLEFKRDGSCSCHINPPCSACVDSFLACPGCGWEADH